MGHDILSRGSRGGRRHTLEPLPLRDSNLRALLSLERARGSEAEVAVDGRRDNPGALVSPLGNLVEFGISERDTLLEANLVGLLRQPPVCKVDHDSRLAQALTDAVVVDSSIVQEPSDASLATQSGNRSPLDHETVDGLGVHATSALTLVQR